MKRGEGREGDRVAGEKRKGREDKEAVVYSQEYFSM